MKKNFKWLLSAVALSSAIIFGGFDSTYAADTQVAASSEIPFFEDEDELASYLNDELLKYNEEIKFKTYAKDFDYNKIYEIIQGTDAYFDVARLSTSYTVASNGVNTYRLMPAYRMSKEQATVLDSRIKEVISGLELDGKTEYEKVKLIYTYICENVDYDYDHYNDYYYNGVEYPLMYTPYAALIDGKAVCQGYATLFDRMCEEALVSSEIISGTGNGGGHAWNIVKIGDEYFNLDCTWDGQDQQSYYNYFLKNEADFNGHVRDDRYKTDEFNEEHPMAEASWRIFGLFGQADKLYMDNDFQTVSYDTIDGGTVTNVAEGRPKILIYGSTKCYYTITTIRNLASEDIDNVDIVFIDCFDKTTLDEAVAFDETYVKGKFTVAYGIGTAGFWNYVDRLFAVNSITYPVIIYIDGNNKIQYAEYGGCFSADDIKKKIDTYILDKEVAGISEDKLELVEGDNKKISALIYGQKANGQFFTWTSSNPSVATVDENGVVKALSDGTTVITCKINNEISVFSEVTVKGKLKAVSTININGVSNTVVGDTVTFNVDAKGGTGKYTYSLVVKNVDTGKWSKLKDNVTSNTFTWKAGSAGTRLFYVDVKDSSGETIRCDAIKLITSQKLSATSKADKTEVVVGDKVTFKATPKGGTGGYTYSFIVKNETTGQWARIKDGVTSNTFSWKAGSAGTRTFYIDVKDSSGKVVRCKAIKVVTTKQQSTQELSIKASATSSNASTGSKVTIKGVADGGSGDYTYSFVVYNQATKSWYRYKFSSSNTLTWKAGSAGIRKFYVEAKDSAGKVVRSEAVTITVK